MINSIFLQRKTKLALEPKKSSHDITLTASFLANLQKLGYTFSLELIDIIRTYSQEDLVALDKKLQVVLQNMVGADVSYEPMYPNFPKQVMEASYAELFINAILHYLTGALPHYET